jgi:hypothetical protein
VADRALEPWTEVTALRRLAETALAARWLVLGGALAALAAAWLWIRLTPPEYRATMVVAPTETLIDDGAAAAHGGPPEPTAGPAFPRFLQLLTSVEVARRLAGQEWVLAALFPDRWDATGGGWRPPAGFGRWLKSALLGWSTRWPPGPEDLAERLADRLRIETVGGTDMRRLVLRHRDRDTAVALLDDLHRTADAVLREQAANRADAYIAYLDGQLARTTLAEHRSGIAVLLGRQERARMLIAVELPYAAELVEAAAAPMRPSWPDPVLMLPLAALAGAVLGLMAAHARQGWRGGVP